MDMLGQGALSPPRHPLCVGQRTAPPDPVRWEPGPSSGGRNAGSRGVIPARLWKPQVKLLHGEPRGCCHFCHRGPATPDTQG